MSKQEMAQKVTEILCKMFFEDVEFIYGLVMKLAKKRGVRI